MSVISVRVPDDLARAVESRALAVGWSVSRFAREALAVFEPEPHRELVDRVEELEREVGRLRELAGL